jgi:hypothetical protein
MIDITFDMFSDTPEGKDPDTWSPTLRKYHQVLWNKQLPNGTMFSLNLETRQLLHHRSELGEYYLSSDSIGHTYSRIKSMAHIVESIPPEEINSFFLLCSTIGGYIIYPSKRIDNKMTLNGARGTNRKIKDRFDLTLECIRLFYQNNKSPLSETIERYKSYFKLFDNFQGYIDFFLLQDLVSSDYSSIEYLIPFKDFDSPPLPCNVEEYITYKDNMIKFITKRNNRILNTV